MLENIYSEFVNDFVSLHISSGIFKFNLRSFIYFVKLTIESVKAVNAYSAFFSVFSCVYMIFGVNLLSFDN